MTTISNVYRAYSMEYGTFVGLGWGALFLCYVEGISTGNPLLMLLCLMLCGICLVMPFFFAMRLNQKLYAADARLNYVQGLLFASFMFIYACLMNGLIVFSYFKFFDDGSLHEQMHTMLTMPETVVAYQQIGMSEQYAQVLALLKDLNEWSPLDKTLAIFNNNFFFSLVMAFPVALAASYNLQKIRKKQ